MPMTYGEWTDQQNFAIIYELKDFRTEMFTATDANRVDKATRFANRLRQKYPVLQDQRPVDILRKHIEYIDNLVAGDITTKVLKDQYLTGMIPRI